MGLCSKMGAGSLEIVNYLTPLCTNPINEAAPLVMGWVGEFYFKHGKRFMANWSQHFCPHSHLLFVFCNCRRNGNTLARDL